MSKLILQILIVLFLTATLDSHASNLVVSEVLKSGNRIKFKIKWDYSWRGSSNTDPHDAVWVFIKQRSCDAGSNRLPFGHVKIQGFGATTGNIAYNPLRQPLSDNYGVMIRKADVSSGSVEGTIELITDLSAVGNPEIRVLGIEMTYIPTGAFYVGDGVSFKTLGQGNDITKPFQIAAENVSIPLGNQLPTQLYDSRRTTLEQTTKLIVASSIPASFPKGFASFYCMKSEITQQQYADFLNSLSFEQFINRYYGEHETHTLNGNWPLINSGGYPNRACAKIGFQDFAAYLDWAGLRPMTELEFEKVCRGAGQIPKGNEFACGQVLFPKAAGRILDANCSTPENLSETVTNRGTAGVINVGDGTLTNLFGLLDAGFLVTASSNRLTASAGFYGNTELSGNIGEFVISIVSDQLVFSGEFGNGVLTTEGNCNVLNWPLNDINAFGWKGGDFFNVNSAACISQRGAFGVVDPEIRSVNIGGRGVAIAVIQ